MWNLEVDIDNRKESAPKLLLRMRVRRGWEESLKSPQNGSLWALKTVRVESLGRRYSFLVLNNNNNVLVCLGCRNKISQTMWLINSISLLLIVLEAGSSRSRCQHCQVLAKTLFWVSGSWLLTVSSHGEWG